MSCTRGTLSLFVLLLLLTSYLFGVSSADSSSSSYTWYDCGPPLTKTISYQSITLYPPTFDVYTSLSLNIQAFIESPIEEFTTTTIQVYRDGDIYVNTTQVEDLCNILNANSISCPYDDDSISFTYEIQSGDMPVLTTADYSLKIVNELDGNEVGCLYISGPVNGIEEADSCTYTSKFAATLGGSLFFEHTDASERAIGDWIQVGPTGYSPSAIPWGTVANFDGSTPDVTPSIAPSYFIWALSGSLNNITNGTNVQVQTWTGTFEISYNDTNSITQVYDGVFTLTDEIHTDSDSRTEVFSGVFTLTSGYSYFSQLYYPMTLGNLGPLAFSENTAGGSYMVQSQQVWCTCEVDACNVCGGDDSSCNLGTTSSEELLPSRAIAAIVVSAFGFVVLVVLVSLYIKRRRFIKPINDDLDLLDPQKPDYGTMAINEIMNDAEEDVQE